MHFRNLTGVQVLVSEFVLHTAVSLFCLCKLVYMNQSCTHSTYQPQHRTGYPRGFS